MYGDDAVNNAIYFGYKLHTRTILCITRKKKAPQRRVQHQFSGGFVVALEPYEDFFFFPCPTEVGWSAVLAGVGFFLDTC